tara:strand:+ start:50212 stop:50361 length:150 start_codon:yes stop_codon:yes gene_type:complete
VLAVEVSLIEVLIASIPTIFLAFPLIDAIPVVKYPLVIFTFTMVVIGRK